MARWSHIAAAMALCLLLAGCPATGAVRGTAHGGLDGAAAIGSDGAAGTGVPLDPGSSPTAENSPRLPPYQGPPAGGPPSAGPLTTVRAAVELASGTAFRADDVVAAPSGGAYVSLAPQDGGGARRLVTVGRTGSRLEVLRSVPTPGVGSVWGLYRSAGGQVVVAGRVGAVGPGRGGYGFDVVDPVSGVVRVDVLVPYADGTISSFGRSGMSADGRTLYLFVSVDLGQVADERLLAVDVATGAVRADRRLGADLRAVTLTPIGNGVAGLVARPHGGVTMAFDAMPASGPLRQVPTLLTYDAGLHPVGSAVPVIERADGAQTSAVAAAADGTVFLSVQVAQEAWILAVADRGGAGPVLAQVTKSRYDDALVVEPAQVWALMPAPEGARAIDLTDGTFGAPVDLGCDWQDVRAIAPGSDGSSLLVGVCNSSTTRRQMLWVLGP
ncbi:MAG: hypothetical protein QOJ68_457 [Blastococcus sp.]|jgi:hypothetical protein|nr:hypothetical protein [Blastococcus sp.]